jgi:hypothetical protein
MRYRDTRQPCRYATQFLISGERRGGTILDVSRSGMLAFVGNTLRPGQKVRFSLARSELSATIVRFDSQGHAALRFERPLTHSEHSAFIARTARPRSDITTLHMME